ncbi:MAG: hypothetical protein WD431_13210 [Cyclobacteriaceae bacterium]
MNGLLSKPFQIKSKNLTTTVLGTSFNIRTYESDSIKEVAVVTGKLRVSRNQKSGEKREIILQTNQKAIFSKRGNQDLLIKGLEESEVKALEFSKFDFNETSLENIIKVWNAEHGVNITIKDRMLKNCVINADLTDLSL